MSSLAYNGVEIKVVRTVSYSRRAVYDGPTYLYTRHRIHVQGVYAPRGGTSYFLPLSANPTSAPRAADGNFPETTDESIRHLLMQPRKRLRYSAAASEAELNNPPAFGVPGVAPILDVPPTRFRGRNLNFASDVTNGPTPLFANVTRIDGRVAWRVEFVVEADVNECYLYYSNPVVMLSHRWTMEHDIDVHAFTHRIIRGHAIFRRDVLTRLGLRADDFRAYLFHPLEVGFRRERVYARLSEDGLRLDYAIFDRELSHNVLKRGLTRVEGRVSVSRHKPGNPEEAAFAAAGMLDSILGQAAQAVSAVGTALGGGGVPPPTSGQGGISAALSPLMSGRKYLTSESVEIHLRLWGNRNTTHDQLIGWGNNLLNAKLFDVAARALVDLRWRVSADVAGRYVELHEVRNIPPVTLALTGDLFGLIAERYPKLFDVNVGGGVISGRPAQEPGLPGQSSFTRGGARGTYLNALVAQALVGDCAKDEAATQTTLAGTNFVLPPT